MLRLKNLLLILLISINGCHNVGLDQRARDREYKDSLSLAEGKRALGSFFFKMRRDSFEIAKARFFDKYGHKLYGQDLQTIDAKFNHADQLWKIIFVSPVEWNKNGKHPYFEFAKKKFGLETKPGVWQVGLRKIMLTKENRSLDMFWFLERNYEQRIRKGIIDPKYNKQYDPLETFDFYVMTIQNDSLHEAFLQETEHRSQIEQIKYQCKQKAEHEARQQQFMDL